MKYRLGRALPLPFRAGYTRIPGATVNSLWGADDWGTMEIPS